MTEDMENIETTNDDLEKFKQKYEVTWLQEIKTTLLFSVGLIILCLALFLALFFTRSLIKDVGTIKRYVRLFDNTVSTKSLEENLKEITKNPHYAGTSQSEQLGRELTEKLKTLLGSKVHVYNETYEVLLPFPSGLSTLTYTDGTNTESASLFETPIEGPTTAPPKAIETEEPYSFWNKSWIAYSKAGTASGKLFYVNYGRVEDFKKLAEDVNLEGTIVIARYGMIFRGQKVKLAQDYKCAGIILYSDPADDGKNVGEVYPNGLWRPETSLQRGSAMFLAEQPGDPTTPGFPSLPNTRNRIQRSEAKNLPTIPILAISAHDARNFLKHLEGKEVPGDWVGGFESAEFKYKFGSISSSWTVSMDVKVVEKVTPIHNYFARIEGKTEPDRLVMLGNHRDAWVYGATDPHSGTSLLLEVAKAFGEMLKNGWRPKRTVIFALWDAEEQGLIGSTEFVEQYRENLASQLVAYVNVDTFQGEALSVVGSASLGQIVRESAADVSTGNGTLLSLWESVEGKDPIPKLVGSGSDYTGFYHHVGIPILDLSFRQKNQKMYGAYHSIIDTFEYFSKFIDKEFKYGEALTKLVGRVILKLADDVVLHFNIQDQAAQIQEEVKTIQNATVFQEILKTQSSDYVSELNDAYNLLVRASQAYLEAGKVAHKNLDDLRKLDAQSLNYETKIRTHNDKVSRAERGFVSTGGLPGRPWYRHVISAPGKDLGYGFEVFPAVKEALRAKEPERKELLLNALTNLADSIDSATSFVTGTFTNRNTVSA